MTDQALDRFLDTIKQSGIISASAWTAVSPEIHDAQTSEEAATRLVEKGALTSYQAERLLQGMPEDCVLAERYHLLDKIGAGGMGAVFRARDSRLNRTVAIKVMAPQALNQPDAVVRFQREARTLAQLQLPNIVQAFDSGEDRGRHFLVMEFVEGINLHHLVRDKGPVAPTVAADYIYQTASGLSSAHEAGLIHRDIKPGNLVLSKDGEIKILDLGLARFLQDQIPDPEVTRANTGLGTPDYMAPEQFRDAHQVDVRADIYSLGCTLYFLIAGLPPFPGSSLSEKAQAHENKEPPPLEERCPEVPAGLAQTVYKMMAKRPRDRFQTMSEVADGLALYVAGSSKSLPQINRTLTWQGRRLTARPLRRLSPWAAGFVGSAAAATLTLGILWFSSFWDRTPASNGGDIARREDPRDDKKLPDRDIISPKDETREKKSKDDKDDKLAADKKDTDKTRDKDKKEPPKVITIENGLTVARDGSGQFTSVAAALDKIQPGQIIRVLDAGPYKEALRLNRTSQLGITIEAPKEAMLLAPAGTNNLIEIRNVADVTLRGLRLRAEKPLLSFVFARGACPGLLIEGLDMTAPVPETGNGIELQVADLPPGAMPVLIRGNAMNDCHIGVLVAACGFTKDYGTPYPSSRVRIEDNRFTGGHSGVVLLGCLKRVQVVGNRVVGAAQTAFQLENLLDGAEDILIANNTTLECNHALRLWDTTVRGKNVTIANNLCLASSERDMIYLDSGGDPNESRGPGPGKAVTDAWNLHHNWREMKDEKVDGLGWIPPGPKDKGLSKIEVLSRKQDDKDFLRPAKGPLKTEGAGKEHPGLPTYVGAVAPEGAPVWNWQWTWDVYCANKVTVAQEERLAPRFRTISAALAFARPGMAIHVLDAAIYKEQVVFVDPATQRGVQLIAEKGATIEMLHVNDYALKIDGVPEVRVKGFRFSSEGHPTSIFKLPLRFCVFVTGRCPGVIMEDLTIAASDQMSGINLLNCTQEAGEAPVVVRQCKVDVGGYAIYLSGLRNVTSGILIQDNRVTGMKGFTLEQKLENIQISGNVARDGGFADLEFLNLSSKCKNILVANNTFYGGSVGVRFWEEAAFAEFPRDEIAVRNNVIFGPSSADILYVRVSDKKPQHADGVLLRDLCSFDHNARDFAGQEATPILPAAKGDLKLERKDFVSLVASREGFLRPRPDTPFATQGAGKIDALFPTYMGALPPADVPTWDWAGTWKKRQMK